MSPAEIVQMMIVGGCVAVAVFLTVTGYKVWKGDKYLCDDCKYNDPESCHKPERPTAVDCAAYVRGEPASPTQN